MSTMRPTSRNSEPTCGLLPTIFEDENDERFDEFLNTPLEDVLKTYYGVEELEVSGEGKETTIKTPEYCQQCPTGCTTCGSFILQAQATSIDAKTRELLLRVDLVDKILAHLKAKHEEQKQKINKAEMKKEKLVAEIGQRREYRTSVIQKRRG